MAAIWSRLDNEPEDAWKAYQIYRDRGACRSLYSLGCPPQKALEWYNQYSWNDRVIAYDQLLDSEKVNARAHVLAKAEKNMADDIEAHLVKLQYLLDKELARFVDSWSEGTLPNLKPAEYAKLIEVAIKNWRLIKGQSTENVSGEFDFSKFSTSELEAMLKKAKGDR